MLTITKEQFLKKAAKYNTVLMSAHILADTTTPIQLFHLFNKDAAFLLESKDPLSPWSNYSFIGINPIYYLYDKGGSFIFENKKRETILRGEHVQETWDNVLTYLNVAPNPQLELPFPGGAVGYMGFEAYGCYEPRLAASLDRENPNVSFVFCQTILAYHHGKEELTVIHLQNTADIDGEEAFQNGAYEIESILKAIAVDDSLPVSMVPMTDHIKDDLFANVSSNYTKETFMHHVQKVKEYIAAGDIFQAVLSQRFKVPVQTDGLSLYRVLRKINPSPYLYYIRLDEREIIGSSPERLVKVEREGELEIHPIAGTRKRGNNLAEDEALAKDLLADEKERAEHLMLVDLARNDMGRVSEYGSVKVKEMMQVTHFSHVMHLISKVTGQLKKDTHPFEALFAAHPAGTVSGAPKVRAVEIIEELEQTRRGIYAGAIAYCGFNQAIDSCIAIRTIILQDRVAHVQAGAGIVQDSIPENEYEETRNKARALIYAIKLAELRYEKEEEEENE
jgi:anthranilate synthase component 1